MDGSLNQPCRVEEEGTMYCKLLLPGGKVGHVWPIASTRRISIG